MGKIKIKLISILVIALFFSKEAAFSQVPHPEKEKIQAKIRELEKKIQLEKAKQELVEAIRDKQEKKTLELQGKIHTLSSSAEKLLNESRFKAVYSLFDIAAFLPAAAASPLVKTSHSALHNAAHHAQHAAKDIVVGAARVNAADYAYLNEYRVQVEDFVPVLGPFKESLHAAVHANELKHKAHEAEEALKKNRVLEFNANFDVHESERKVRLAEKELQELYLKLRSHEDRVADSSLPDPIKGHCFYKIENPGNPPVCVMACGGEGQQPCTPKDGKVACGERLIPTVELHFDPRTYSGAYAPVCKRAEYCGRLGQSRCSGSELVERCEQMDVVRNGKVFKELIWRRSVGCITAKLASGRPKSGYSAECTAKSEVDVECRLFKNGVDQNRMILTGCSTTKAFNSEAFRNTTTLSAVLEPSPCRVDFW